MSFALVARRDTTAAMLSWMFLMLAKHPPILADLRSAIVNDFGTEEAPNTISMNTEEMSLPTMGDVRDPPALFPWTSQLQSCWKRNYSTYRWRSRRKKPHAVQKGQAVNLRVYAMQRRTDLWGEDVLEFKPERWEKKKKSDWTFLAFFRGPRTCLRRNFALLPSMVGWWVAIADVRCRTIHTY